MARACRVSSHCVAAILVCLLAGCTTAKFRVVDAATDAPLEGVQIDGYRFRPLQQIPADFAWKAMDVDPTDRNGESTFSGPLSIVQNENEFQFVFTKAGYRPAEAIVDPDHALLVSPADDAGWIPVENDPHHLVNHIPTRNFERVSGKGTMVVRLYRNKP